MADGGCVGLNVELESERVMKAKGREPLRASGMGMMQASAMEGWEVMACSIWPVLWG